MFFILVMMSISCVFFYMGVGYVLLENSLLDSRKQKRAAKKIELRGCWDFILGQLQKTIRLQLSLFTNYRNSYV